MSALRLRLEWVFLLALAIAAALWGQWANANYRMDTRMLDYATALARPEANSDIAIVAIDDRSLAEIGAWPWPRSAHARLIEQLEAQGARLILYDVLFIEPTQPQDDTALALALEQTGKVILPHAFGIKPDTVDRGFEPLMPLAALADRARGVGHVDAAPDSDGVLRRFALQTTADGQTWAHFTVVAAAALGKDTGIGHDLLSPVVPFQAAETFTTVSAVEVLSGRLAAGNLQDKIVLVGATAPGMGDRYAVASGDVALMPGVETQANLLNALLADSLIATASWWWQAMLSIVSLLALFLIFWFLPPRFGLVGAALLLLGIAALSIALVPLAGLWLPVGSLLIVILLAYPLWSWRRLTAVSSYLDREAARLVGPGKPVGELEGVDFIAQQVARVRQLVSNVSDSLDFLRKVIEAAPDAIIVLDKDGMAQMMNAKGQALFPEWHAEETVSLPELMDRTGASWREQRGELETVDGKTFLLARATLATSNGEAAGGEIIALREVTEIRRREEERKQMLEFLSHDMRTPQVAIIGLAGRALEDAKPPEMLKRIRKQAERTLKLADDFVQLARLEETSIQREDSDLGALVEEACDRFYAPAQGKKITLEQGLPEDPIFANVDASLIARMLDNLIGNAIKYSPEQTTISVSLAAQGESDLLLSVSDEGPGLPEERLANPFARFGAHESHAGPSAGLGLAFVKRVVETHGGSIDVQSRTGEGTRFAISLPQV